MTIPSQVDTLSLSLSLHFDDCRFPQQGDRKACSPSKRKHACPFVAMSLLLPFPNPKAKLNSSLHGVLNGWKTLCPIPEKVKWVMNNADAVMLLFCASDLYG
jgi:hypothetical protein